MLFLAAVAAHAALSGDAVAIPIGNIIASVLVNTVTPLVGIGATIFVAWIGAHVGGEAKKVLQSMHADRLITQAVDQALATTEGAARGQTLTVNIANNVIRSAAQWLVDHAPEVEARIEKQAGTLIAAKLSSYQIMPSESKASDLDLTPKTIKPGIADTKKDIGA